MGNTFFDFKKFRIRHDRCAMKVGTDSVLLGSWARVEGSCRVLDVGSGCGVLSLMAAQRLPGAIVVGIEIDEAAVEQANENLQSSPFCDRVTFHLSDVRDFVSCELFDCILCNPPFYTEDILPPSTQRSLARNAHNLPFEDLVRNVSRLLVPAGMFHVVLPKSEEVHFTALCNSEGLTLSRLCDVKTTKNKPAKRVLCSYSRVLPQSVEYEEIIIMENGMRSKMFQALTNDFYLDAPQSF